MRILLVLHLVAALGCALNAGIFFAFSSFVMKALGDLPAPQGMAAMQRINRMVMTPSFALVFFGTPLACLVVIAVAAMRWHAPGSLCLMAGALLHVVGSLGVTIAFNVPLNDALARAAAGTPEGAALWARYLRIWTLWNGVRTAAGVAATLLLVLALYLQARGSEGL